MIYTDSRYAKGIQATVHDARVDDYSIAVYRKFPSAVSRFFIYMWNESDRLDLVAFRYLGSPSHWWKIMDYNPEIINPNVIPVGAQIRIPYE